MAQTSSADALAVLIDCQNIAPTHAPALFKHIETLGTPMVRRLYGNGSNDFSGWKKSCEIFGIEPIQQIGCVPGKNAADMSMVIGAMDLLQTGRFKAFCLVSSDSDFAALAMRIRAEGVKVHGFGEAKTATGFVSACETFTKLTQSQTGTAEKPRAIAPAPPKAERATGPVLKLVPGYLSRAMALSAGSDGWASASLVGKHLGADRQKLGEGKLSSVLAATGFIEVDLRRTGGVYVRFKTPNSSAGEASR